MYFFFPSFFCVHVDCFSRGGTWRALVPLLLCLLLIVLNTCMCSQLCFVFCFLFFTQTHGDWLRRLFFFMEINIYIWSIFCVCVCVCLFFVKKAHGDWPRRRAFLSFCHFLLFVLPPLCLIFFGGGGSLTGRRPWTGPPPTTHLSPRWLSRSCRTPSWAPWPSRASTPACSTRAPASSTPSRWGVVRPT